MASPLIRCRQASATAAIALVLLVGACKAVDTTTASHGLGGEIDFQVSGGFAGVRQSLRIARDGQLVARDDKRGTEVRRQLDPPRLAQIRAAFAKAGAQAEKGARGLSGRCNDCIEYSVSATIDDVRHQVTMNSGVPPNAAYDDAVQLLSTILQETLSRQGTSGPEFNTR